MNIKYTLPFLRFISFLEALSAIYLFFVAIPQKYMMGIEDAVKVPGMVHGVLFTIYCFALLPVYKTLKWNFKTLFICGLLSIPPGGTIYADFKYFKKK